MRYYRSLLCWLHEETGPQDTVSVCLLAGGAFVLAVLAVLAKYI